jgi:hypothetical protein
MVDWSQPESPTRHRDFILGWIGCYDSHQLRPHVAHVTLISEQRRPGKRTPPPPAPPKTIREQLAEAKTMKTIYEKLMEAQERRYRITLSDPPSVSRRPGQLTVFAERN